MLAATASLALLAMLVDADGAPPRAPQPPVPTHASVAAWSSSTLGDEEQPQWTVTLRVLQRARSGASGEEAWARAPAAALRTGVGPRSARLPGPEPQRPARAVTAFRAYRANAPPPPAA
ncbi:MAG TPA: hypothetical protein VFQ22_05075 [Longimicrobiales bacterium]|nr:hypothetical protein [Longimicrobiales bacterium]